jgi:integrase
VGLSLNNSGILPTPVLTQLPFAKACEAWLESRRSYISAKTYYEYSLNIKTLKAFFGELRLPEIDGDLVRAYQRMRQQKCGAFAINHECNLLCQIRKRIGMPLTDYQPLPLPKEVRGRALSEEERLRLFRIAASNPQWQAVYLAGLISINTSAGPKETMTLRMKDIDLVRGTIRIQPNGAKNVYRIRTIPLNKEARRAVEAAMERAKQFGSTEPNHYLFPFRVGKGDTYDPERHQTTFKTAWLALRDKAQLHGLRMYDLRHHAITSLLENPDISEETVEDIAGHVSRRMKKRYSHIRMEYKRAAVDAILSVKKPVQSERRTRNRHEELDVKAVQNLVQILGKLLKSG